MKVFFHSTQRNETHHTKTNLESFEDQSEKMGEASKLNVQWAEPVSLTSRTNQKQELPMAAMFVNGSGQNQQSL